MAVTHGHTYAVPHKTRATNGANGSVEPNRDHLASPKPLQPTHSDEPFSTFPARNTRIVPVLALSPDEAAAALGISRDYLDEHVSHELAWVRRGRRKFVAVRELERWLDAAAERTL